MSIDILLRSDADWGGALWSMFSESDLILVGLLIELYFYSSLLLSRLNI